MSRCFPFPPLGYEKKTRPNEDANLLIKENHKDKKQDKDKDKEKKERKEKKEKNIGKHREKKEKKHKHKDKKEKSWHSEEKNTSEKKKIAGLSDHQISEKIGVTDLQVGETQTSRLLLDFGKKVRNGNGGKGMQIVERITITDLSVKSPGKVLEHKVGIMGEGNKKFKEKKEENRIPNGQTVNSNMTGLAYGFEGRFYQEDKVMEEQKDRKVSNKHKDSDNRGDEDQGRDREEKSKSRDKKRKTEKEKEEKAKDLSVPMLSKVRESGNNSIDLKNDKCSYVFKESTVHNRILSKRKESETDVFSNGHEIQNKKLLRLVSCSHQVIQNGSRIGYSSSPGNHFALEKEAAGWKHKSNAKFSSSVSLVENGRKLEMAQTAINIAPERQQAVSKHAKAYDSFSFLKPALGSGQNLDSCQAVRSFTDLEQGVVTNNAEDNKVLSLLPVAENGKKSGSSQLNNLNPEERQVAACNPKLSDKESRSNGFMVPKLDERASRIKGLLELKKHTACAMGLPSVPLEHKEIVETHMRPPHPDDKYLSEILSIPQVGWSDTDEQNWLMSFEDNQAKKPKYVSSMIEESKQVWAGALQMESVDVTALPYVIPY